MSGFLCPTKKTKQKKKVHRKIRQDPGPWPKKERDYTKMDVRLRPGKLTTEQRLINRRAKIEEMRRKAAENEDGGDNKRQQQAMEIDEDEDE